MANFLSNPSFDVDLSSWTLNDTVATVTLTRDTTTVHTGAGSAKMVNSAAGQDDYIDQFTALGGMTGLSTAIVSAWVNCTVFTSGAISNRGLWVQTAPTNFITYESTVTAATSGWEQRVLVVALGAGDSRLDVRLYAPQGTIFWDDIDVEIVPGYSNHFNPIPLIPQGRSL